MIFHLLFFGFFGLIAAIAIIKFRTNGRVSVHALAQGGFSAMRGGNFWQGAAAGFVSSFAGSAAQGVGIHGWGMVGISRPCGYVH